MSSAVKEGSKYLLSCQSPSLLLICQQTATVMTWPWAPMPKRRQMPRHTMQCKELTIYNQDSDRTRSVLGDPAGDGREAGGRQTRRLLQ